MPNRILREGILTSQRVDSLSNQAELFYRRLMSRLDDHGRYEAHPELLRTACYPLRVDKVKAKQIVSWLGECENAGLLVTYKAFGKSYIQALDWRQQARSDSKCPAPDEQLLLRCTADAHLVVGGVVGVCEDDKSNVGQKPDASKLVRKNALEVLIFLNEKTGRNYQPVPANIELIVARLKDGASVDDLRAVVAKKSREWKGDEKMDEFLRPKTLFNRTNFAQYQGELGAAAIKVDL